MQKEEQQRQQQQQQRKQQQQQHDDNDDNDDFLATRSAAVQESNEEHVPNESPPPLLYRQLLVWLGRFYSTYEFLILVVCAILAAYAYPPLGSEFVQPQVTAAWVTVCFIFVLAGIYTVRTKKQAATLTQQSKRLRFHVFVPAFNLGGVSAALLGVSRLLKKTTNFNTELADGMVVAACLPLTINMVLVLTQAAHGDTVSAVFHAALGNLLGVFLSPVLILAYTGGSGEVDRLGVVTKLALRVLVPVASGYFLQRIPAIQAWFMQHKQRFKRLQIYALVFIVYTVFSKTFANRNDSTRLGATDIVLLIAVQFACLSSLMGVAWLALGFVCGKDQPKLRVMGLFGCTHKTVAMGVPLIQAIYGESGSAAKYTLPLLIWHPMQLILGTLLAPRLAAWVDGEVARLECENDTKTEESDAVCAAAATSER